MNRQKTLLCFGEGQSPFGERDGDAGDLPHRLRPGINYSQTLSLRPTPCIIIQPFHIEMVSRIV